MHLEKPLLSTAHCVLGPHGDGSHGFEGSSQAISGGCPSYSGRQKQTGAPSTRRQPELGPQGFGVHSSPSGTVRKVAYRIYSRLIMKLFYLLQFLKGFPVSPLGQKQIGLPLSSSHCALSPHGLGSHGSCGGLQPTSGLPL